MNHPLNVPPPSDPSTGRSQPRHPLEAQRIPASQPQTQPAGQQVILPQSRPILVYALLAINIFVFVIDYYVLGGQYSQLGGPLTQLGEKSNEAILAGQYWRFITPMFLHANVVHLGLNCMSLYVVGLDVERLYGTIRFAGIYFLSGIAGVILSFAFLPNPSIGASGAIFGLVGALLPFLYRNRAILRAPWQRMRSILVVIGLNLVIGVMSGVVDNSGHIGGLLGGLALGWFSTPLLKVIADYASQVTRITDESSPAIALAATLAFGMFEAGVAYLLIVFRISGIGLPL